MEVRAVKKSGSRKKPLSRRLLTVLPWVLLGMLLSALPLVLFGMRRGHAEPAPETPKAAAPPVRLAEADDRKTATGREAPKAPEPPPHTPKSDPIKVATEREPPKAEPPKSSEPSRVTLAVPTASSTVSGTVRVSGDLTHDRPVTKVELLVDDKVVASADVPKDVSLTWAASPPPPAKPTLTTPPHTPPAPA